jgi:SRSO17 transposase
VSQKPRAVQSRATTHVSEAHRWANQPDDLVAQIGSRFSRIEPCQRARAYLQGLLSPLERKNDWHLVEAAGDPHPDGVQDFLARMHWDADAVCDDLLAYAVEHLGDPRGHAGARRDRPSQEGRQVGGRQRQYSGTAGRIENCQIGVFLAVPAAMAVP